MYWVILSLVSLSEVCLHCWSGRWVTDAGSSSSTTLCYCDCYRLRTVASVPLQTHSPVSCLSITNGAAHILVGLRDASLIVLTSPPLSELKGWLFMWLHSLVVAGTLCRVGVVSHTVQRWCQCCGVEPLLPLVTRYFQCRMKERVRIDSCDSKTLPVTSSTFVSILSSWQGICQHVITSARR